MVAGESRRFISGREWIAPPAGLLIRIGRQTRHHDVVRVRGLSHKIPQPGLQTVLIQIKSFADVGSQFSKESAALEFI